MSKPDICGGPNWPIILNFDLSEDKVFHRIALTINFEWHSTVLLLILLIPEAKLISSINLPNIIKINYLMFHGRKK